MDSETEKPIFARFQHYDELVRIQRQFLSLDLSVEPTEEEDRNEESQLNKLSTLLSYYQEQPYLLDPYLEQLLSPVVEIIKVHASAAVKQPQSSVSRQRLWRMSRLLHNYVQFRGYKTITRFFPHEIADLSIALDYIRSPISAVHETSQWPLRYVILLWLSLICLIPFDLAQFDESGTGETAAKIENLAKSYMDKPGLERSGAALLLARLYMRTDMKAKLAEFLEYAISTIQDGKDLFKIIAFLQVLCEVTKSGSAEEVKIHFNSLLKVASLLQGNEYLMSNTVIRKLRTKLMSRVILRVLPVRAQTRRRRGRVLVSDTSLSATETDDQGDVDIPEEAETVLEELFQALQDNDTIVRWSSAKGIARIAERLTPEFAEQVLDTIMGLFSIHSVTAASMYDMPSIAESTWHGACLACAEMARRGLVADEKLSELIQWLFKALYFDIRKGAHSIGSNVRDATAYILWSLARAQSVSALEPHADILAQKLVAVALFDREISIRRAASAAYQEFVGRTSLFSHGIDVIRKTDFYAVGVRRHAFLIAAPEVAEHLEYRPYLLEHLLNTTLRHWDPVMRQLGAQSLRAICELDLPVLGPDVAQKASKLLHTADSGDAHAALLTLSELAAAFRESTHDLEPERQKIFAYLAEVPLTMIQAPRHESMAAAACLLISNSISPSQAHFAQGPVPHWKNIVDFAIQSKSDVVQEAAAIAMASLSKVFDCSPTVDRSGSPAVQQSVCRILGVLDYNAHPHGLEAAINCLLNCVDRSNIATQLRVEVRRNAFISMPQILSTVAPRLAEHLSPAIVGQMIDALQDGLTDYTTDERGDVGSWVRLVCVKGLTQFIEILLAQSPNLSNFAEYLPSSKYHAAVGGILKQGLERLDNVRQQTGVCVLQLLLLPLPSAPHAEDWAVHGADTMRKLFLSDSETESWGNGSWLFPKAVHLLDISTYRDSVLAGLIMSTSSKTDSTQRPVTTGLVTYARSLPLTTTEPDHYDLNTLAQDLVALTKRSLTSNNVVVPVLQTFNVFLEGDVFEDLASIPSGLQSLREMLSLTSRNAQRLKNTQRIMISMKVIVNFLPVKALRGESIGHLATFLSHQYPRIRAATAEHLYLVLQSKDLGFDTDEIEDILLQTEWLTGALSSINDASTRCIELLRSLNEDA